jgi:hypothetical protein
MMTTPGKLERNGHQLGKRRRKKKEEKKKKEKNKEKEGKLPHKR